MTKKDARQQPLEPYLPTQLSLVQMSALLDEDCTELGLIQDCVIEEQIAENIVVSQVIFKNKES